MHFYLLSLKRAWRSVYFPVLLLILTLSLVLSVSLGESEEIPLAGVCDLDGSISSARVCRYLLDNHFVLCQEETVLRERIASGDLSCGVILPANFEDILLTGNVAGSVRFITSPTSFLPHLYKNHVTAALFSEHAAIISAEALAGTDIDRDELIQTYREMMDEGVLFSFETEYADSAGTAAPQSSDLPVRNYAMSTASLLVFVMLMFSVCELLTGDMRALPGRIGAKYTILYAVIPSMAVRIAGILLASAAAAGVSFLWNGSTVLASLLIPICLYTLAASAAALLTAALFPRATALRIFTFFVLLGSFVLCPVYLDAALFLPVIRYVRPLFPPYWLWILAECPAFALLIVVMLPLSLIALSIRLKHKTEH